MAEKSTQMCPNDGAALTRAKLESMSKAELEEQLMRRDQGVEDRDCKIQSLEEQISEMRAELIEYRIKEEEQRKSAIPFKDSRSKMEIKLNKKVNVTLSDEELGRLAATIPLGSDIHLKLERITESSATPTVVREVQSFLFGKLIDYNQIDMLVFLREVVALVQERKIKLPSIKSDSLGATCEVDGNVKSDIKTQDTGFAAEITKAAGGNIPTKRKRLRPSAAEVYKVSTNQSFTAGQPGRGSTWFQHPGASDDETYLDDSDYGCKNADRFDTPDFKE